MTKRLLLSIDGGGVRGIIPARCLEKLEAVSGRPARESFAFVAGTSTGALIAAAVAAGVPAREIRDLYLYRAKEIFPRSPFNVIRQLLFAWIYSTARLHEVIAQALGPARGWRLDDSPIDLLLTAKRVPDGKPWYFVKDNPRNGGCTGRLSLVDCATASAAAPTYFKPFPMPEPKEAPPGAGSPPRGCEMVGTLVDGGVGVTGNPLYEACIEAFDYSEGYAPEETIAVSLGTGHYTPRRMPTWIYPWLSWILDELLASPEEQQTEITRRLYPQMMLYRMDIELPRNIPLDGVGEMAELDRYGLALAEQIDWEAILAGREERFRVGAENARHRRYARRIS